MSAETIYIFALAAVLLALSPGPDILFVFTQSLVSGARVGVWVTFGLGTGLIFHSAMVALGLAAVIKTSPVLYTAITWLGAAYLLWLAWQSWRSAVSVGGCERIDTGWWALYRRGIVMNISNPKVAIFFLAFLPQFTQSGGWPIAVQVMVLGLTFMLCGFAVFISVAFAAGWLNKRFVTPTRLRILNRCAAIVFVAMALRLVLV